MCDLKFHAIMQSSGTIIILRSKKKKNISLSNTKYTKHPIKSYKCFMSIHAIVSF